MSLYNCEKCGVVENTALSRYWTRGSGPALCSECDPGIGAWHGRFPRKVEPVREEDKPFDATRPAGRVGGGSR